VEVPDSEEVAIHVVPESCAARREVCGEALTGVGVGQPLSHEMFIQTWVPTPLLWRKATRAGALSRASVRPDGVSGAKGNASQSRACRTQSRESVFQRLDRVRQAARQRGGDPRNKGGNGDRAGDDDGGDDGNDRTHIGGRPFPPRAREPSFPCYRVTPSFTAAATSAS
jgi:hypothetical protein